MYLIISSTRQYFKGDWDEDTPKWSSNLNDIYVFDTKESALETMRKHIEADRAGKRSPGFAGCRVTSYEAERERLTMKELHAAGYKASFNEDCTAIWIDFDERKTAIEKAIATFPREFYGLSVCLRASGRYIKWDFKRA